MHDITAWEILRYALGHLFAQLGEVVVGKPSIKQARGIVHLSMSYEMHNRPVLTHPAPSSPIPKRLRRQRPPQLGALRRSDPPLYHRAPRKGTKPRTHSAAGKRPSRAWHGRRLRRPRWTAAWR